mmetsp:Transcript_1488/g.6218  ORF Transcript_1488/g.6218 Transcript_1488/m.6218 type:complete len:229 (-) Transcript_1488:659-1345(-)
MRCEASFRTWITSTYVLYTAFNMRMLGAARMGTARYTPVISTRSPGFASSTNESKTHMDTVCGVSPSGIASGVSCILICCLFANTHRLCTSVMVPIDSQSALRHLSGGSFTRPRSTNVKSGASPHTRHLKYAIFRSGITDEHRVTMPRTATSLSMSLGFKSRIARVSFKLNVRTCTRVKSSSPGGSTRSAKCSFATWSNKGTISCGYDTSFLYNPGSYASRCWQSRSS